MPSRKHKTYWIQGAVSPKAKGATTRRAKAHHESMGALIKHDLHSKNSKTRHRAQFAANIRRITRKHRK
jgi:hypothetical protein